MTTPGLSSLRDANQNNLTLTIPAAESRALRAAGAIGELFRCELTEDGILFRRVTKSDLDLSQSLPAWATNGSKAVAE